MHRLKRLRLAAPLALVLVGCPGPPPAPPPPVPTPPSCVDGGASVAFADVQAGIFTPSCVKSGCHSGAKPAEDLRLTEGQSHAALLGRTSQLDPSGQLVVPGDPEGSELYVQVRSGLMPQREPHLPAEQVALIHDWICQGAPND